MVFREKDHLIHFSDPGIVPAILELDIVAPNPEITARPILVEQLRPAPNDDGIVEVFWFHRGVGVPAHPIDLAMLIGPGEHINPEA